MIRTGEFFHLHYAGKKGFNSIAQRHMSGRTLNLWQLSQIADKLAGEKKPATGEKVVIDLKQLGFRKLLGTGAISRAVQVKVDKCSESAVKKIKDAGGEAILKSSAAPSAPAK